MPFAGEKCQRLARRFALRVRRAEGRRAGLFGADAFAAIASTSTRNSGLASEVITRQRRGRAVTAEEFRGETWRTSEILVTGQKRGDFHHVADSHAGIGSTARMFCHTTSVCSSMVAGTDPSGRTPIWPAT